MPAENPYRLALAVVLVVTLSIGLFHRLRAASGEKISHRAEGYAFAAILRLFGLALAVAVLGYFFFPRSLAWAALPLPAWLRWLGAVTGGLGALLMYWTMASLGKNLTDTVVTRANATLVTHGPYRWVRHPFYVTAAVLMASVTLLAANWLIGVGSLVVLTLLAIRTPQEERLLIERFGQDYRDYTAKTGRYFPRIGK